MINRVDQPIKKKYFRMLYCRKHTLGKLIKESKWIHIFSLACSLIFFKFPKTHILP